MQYAYANSNMEYCITECYAHDITSEAHDIEDMVGQTTLAAEVSAQAHTNIEQIDKQIQERTDEQTKTD